jgi:hypothetical protein
LSFHKLFWKGFLFNIINLEESIFQNLDLTYSSVQTVVLLVILYCCSPPPLIHDIVPVARFSLGSYFEKKLQFWGERDTTPKSELGYLIGRHVNPEKSCHGSRLCESCMELPCYWDCWFQDITECSCAGGETHTLASKLFAVTGELE